MRILVVSDDTQNADKIRKIAARCGFESRPTDIVPLSMAANFAARARRDMAVLLASADPAQTLMALRDLCGLGASRVVTIGSTTDAKFMLQVLRDGAGEFVDENDLETELPRSLARLKDRAQNVTRGGAVVGVLGASGGSGTTTVAGNVAVALARRAQPRGTALYDLRLGADDLSLLLNLKSTHSLADLCQHCERMDQNMLQQSLTTHDSGVHLLSAAKSPEQVAAITPRGVRQAITAGRALFPYLLLDLDRTFGPEQVAAISQTDLLIVVMRLDIMSLHNTSRMLAALQDLGFGQERVQLVVNRYGQRKELPLAMVEKALAARLTHFLLDDPAAVNASINHGVPLLLEQPRSKIAKAITALADDVARRCGLPAAEAAGDIAETKLTFNSAAAML